MIFPIVYTVGQDRTSAMHGVAILAGLPVFTGLWAALVMRRLPGAWWLAGCAIALLGEAVIIAVRGGVTLPVIMGVISPEAGITVGF